jgi:hypothetical protein
VRLTLESLERRDNPADYGWSPIDGIYSTTAVNWLKGPGVPYARYTVYDHPPRAGDNLFFVGTLSNADCIIPVHPRATDAAPAGGAAGAPAAPAGARRGQLQPHHLAGRVRRVGGGRAGLAGEHPGVGVRLPGPEYATDLYQSNYTHAGDFTVSGTFSWTGGGIQAGPRAPLNSGGNIVPGKFNLAPTASGVAEPVGGGTVQLGSIVTLQGNEANQTGSTLDVKDGTYNFNNRHVSLRVNPFAALDFVLGAPVPKPPGEIDGVIRINHEKADPAAFDNQISIDHDAKATISPANRRTDRPIASLEITAPKPRIINAGLLEIYDKTDLRFITTNNELGEPHTGEGGGLTQRNDPGHFNAQTVIEAGCSITCRQKTNVTIEAGEFVLKDGPAPGSNPSEGFAQLPVTISSPDETRADQTLVMQENTLLDHNTHTAGGSLGRIELAVTGNVILDGTVKMYLHPAENKNDQINVTGYVSFTEPSRLITYWFESTGTMRAVMQEWTVVSSGYTGNDRDPIRLVAEEDFNFNYTAWPAIEDLELAPVLSNDLKALKVKRTQ